MASVLMLALLCVYLSRTVATNYYIQEWKRAKHNFSVSDNGMVAGYNTKSKLIHIIGGENNQKNQYQYNITTGKTKKLSSSLPFDVYISSPNGVVSMNNIIYFYTEPQGSYSYQQNFFSYNMDTLELVQIGYNYPKPTYTQQSCYSANDIDTIYLIGGLEYTLSNPFSDGYITKTFLSFRISTNEWITGSQLVTARMKSACVYSNGTLFVFGGQTEDADTSNSIEQISVDAMLPGWIALTNVSLSQNAADIQAYMVPDTSTVFIVGPNLCNIFDVDDLSILECPTKLYQSGRPFTGVYVPDMHRFYAFDSQSIIEYNYDDTRIPVDLSVSSVTVSMGQRVPVCVKYSYSMDESFVHLTSHRLHIDTFMTVNSDLDCTLCSEHLNECDDCSNGILPWLDNITLVDATESNSYPVTASGNDNVTHIINSFDISFNLFMNLTESSTEIEPGDTIPIIISNAIFETNSSYLFRLISANQALSINNYLQIDTTEKAINCSIYAPRNPVRVPCDVGVFPLINYNFVSSTNYIFNVSVQQINITDTSKRIDILPSGLLSIAIKVCDPGDGMKNPNTANCDLCVPNTFTLKSDVLPCHICSDNLDGVECKGGNHVIVDYNYWVSAVSNDGTLYPLMDIEPDDEMWSSFCPPAFCCNAKTCDYVELYNHTINNEHGKGLCAQGRNISSPLCGECMHGLSELFGSRSCGICEQTNWIFLVFIILFYSAPFTVYIAYFATSKIKLTNQYVSDQISLLNVLLFDIYFYYFQCLSIVFASKGITVSNVVSSITLSIFNLQLINANKGGMCIFPNINSFEKLMLNFSQPITYLVPLFVIYLIDKYTTLKLSDLICCCCRSKRCYFIRRYFYRTPNILATLIRFLLLFIGTSFSTLFQILTVIKLPNNELIHYYAPHKAINSFTMSMVAMSICVILVIFALFWWYLYRQGEDERQSSKNMLGGFVSSFDERMWYWQFCIFCRRVIIAIYGSFQFLAPVPMNLFLAAFLLFFIVIQVKYYPFKYKAANYMEIICLCSLELILICLNFVSSSEASQFSRIFASLCIFVPLSLFLGFVIRLCYVWWNSDQANCCRKHVLVTGSQNIDFVEESSIALVTYSSDNAGEIN